MSCSEVSSEQLHDYVDGELKESFERQVASHLLECGACRQEVEGIESLVRQAQELPREIQPPKDLWPDISEEMGGWRIGARLKEVGWPAWAALAAASMAAIVLLLPGGSTDSVSSHVRIAVQASYADSETRAAAELARVEDGLEQVRRDLMITFEESRGSLPPETVARIEQSLVNLDAAVGDLRMALDLDPGNRGLNLLIASTYQKEVELLKRLNEL